MIPIMQHDLTTHQITTQDLSVGFVDKLSAGPFQVSPVSNETNETLSV